MDLTIKKITAAGLLSTGCAGALFAQQAASGNSVSQQLNTDKNRPNIIYILADDAGMYELGCYGQKIIKTPNIDQLAEEGMRFTNHYSGSPVCAPSRGTLLTGKHTGHAAIRDNYEVRPEGQLPLKEKELTIAELLKEEGYKTGAIGKWGLGMTGSSGDPQKQGFDYFYGYLCQREAHNYYPTSLWENGKRVELENQEMASNQIFKGDPENPKDYEKYIGSDYAPELMTEKVMEFIDQNKEEPFFLYWPTPIPHVSLQVPNENLKQYSFIEEKGPYLGYQGYLPHYSPRAAYAAMMSHMDTDIGKVMKQLKELGIEDNTIVIFASDNGPTFNGGSDSTFFKSAGDLRGLKCELYEGGIRVPFIVKWPGQVKEASISNHLSAFWDILPTVAEITGSSKKLTTDGISLLATLTGKGEQLEHPYLYWEYEKKMQALRKGKWKAVRLKPYGNIELFDIENDPNETVDLASKNRDIVREMKQLMKTVRTPSGDFPMAGDKRFYKKK